MGHLWLAIATGRRGFDDGVIWDDFEDGWDDEPRDYWSEQTVNLSGEMEKAIECPVVTIRWGGIRGSLEQLLPLDQVEDKPGNFRTGEIGS